jgi:phosphoribosylformimino-5-aminoimidazole carboxamide ribotide isomerase
LELYPAIDLRGGCCVRLFKGDFTQETIYGDDPVALARSFEAAGAGWVHVVDLDAARTSEPVNRGSIAAITAALNIPVQSGGGVRSLDAAAGLFALGVRRVVVGTAAVENPELVAELTRRWPGRVAVGLDHRDGRLAVHGWLSDSGQRLLDAARRFSELGAVLVVTSIGGDGTMAGPDLDGLGEVLAVPGAQVVASGGVGTLEDLEALAGLGEPDRRLAGVIVGRAIYEDRFTVRQAVSILAARSAE